jgi:hypothetical protein
MLLLNICAMVMYADCFVAAFLAMTDEKTADCFVAALLAMTNEKAADRFVVLWTHRNDR